jgi:hypothetical protein
MNMILQSLLFEAKHDVPSFWKGHEIIANYLIRYLNPNIFVELGVHNGFSYFSFCQSVFETKSQTKCFAVDNWKGDKHTGLYEDYVFQQVNSHNHNNYLNFSKLLKMNFDDALNQFKDNSIDLLHIDGYHTYEQVKHDFNSWRPKLSDDAVILFHDVNEFRDDFGVHQLFEELKKIYKYHVMFPFAHGLGLIQSEKAKKEKLVINFLKENEEIIKITQFLHNKNQKNLNLTQVTQAKEQEIVNLTQVIQAKEKLLETKVLEINILDGNLKRIMNSNSMKITSLFRLLRRIIVLENVKKILPKKIINIIKFIKYKINEFLLRKKIYTRNDFNKFYDWSIENKFFDFEYYKNKYKINITSKKKIFKYYIYKGYKLLHNPSEKFSTIIYISLRPDIEELFICPLYHLYKNQSFTDDFIKHSQSCALDREGYESPIYEQEIKSFKKKDNQNIKIFAFFLPGFHEDEYNNKFWKKSFTEWDNLKKNFSPLFNGHKYPFKPFEYYNLEDENIIDQQCKMAKKHGIDGFLIFLYDFNNNISPLYKIIPKLVKILTENKLEFCFMWANEPWTRRWDGYEKDVLLYQDKTASKQQISLFIKKINNFVKQKNYLTIDNKKFFSIYRPEYFINLVDVIAWLNEEFKTYDIEVHLNGCNTFSVSQKTLSQFDSITEYPPHPVTTEFKFKVPSVLNFNFSFSFKNIFLNIYNTTFRVYCYRRFLLFYIYYINFFQNSVRIFRTIIPSWDNTPRKGKDSQLFINYSKSNFAKFLSIVFSDEIKKDYKDKIIFINSWNEWGEGAHIQPDQDYGFWKLNTINQIKTNYQSSILHNSNSKKIFNTQNKNLILVHIYNVEDFDFIFNLTKKYKLIDFLITLPMFKFNFNFQENENLIVKLIHNEERDFNILYQAKQILKKNNHQIISKIHFKRSHQVNKKIISKEDSYRIVEQEVKLNLSLSNKKQNKKNIFIIRKNWILQFQKNYIGRNEIILRTLLKEIKLDWDIFLNLELGSGGIWTIVDHSKTLLNLSSKIDNNKFKLDSFWEPGDGSYSHSLERITMPFFLKNGFDLSYFEDYCLDNI